MTLAPQVVEQTPLHKISYLPCPCHVVGDIQHDGLHVGDGHSPVGHVLIHAVVAQFAYFQTFVQQSFGQPQGFLALHHATGQVEVGDVGLQLPCEIIVIHAIDKRLCLVGDNGAEVHPRERAVHQSVLEESDASLNG